MMRFIFFLFCFANTSLAICQPAMRYEVVIDEIFADPAPPVQLPNAEFIELKNVSGRIINLAGWKLNTTTATSGQFPAYSLPSDSFLIITSTSNAVLFSSFGRVLGIPAFPSLDNDGSVLSVISKEGVIIHAITYEKNWFSNDLKREGGWSLEMIDTRNPCGGRSNWKESVNSNGGSPGRKNSSDAVNYDDHPPELLRSYSSDSVTVIAVFDEPVDSTTGSIATNYKIDGIGVVTAKPLIPLFNKVQLKLSQPMEKQKVYELKVVNLTDCAGNVIGLYNKTKSGLSELPMENDIVINEILFDPLPGGGDYVEIYNRGPGIYNLEKIYIANRTSSGAIGSLKKLSEQDYFFFPGDFIVMTVDATAISKQYFVKQPKAVLEISTLPSFPDDEGVVIILNVNGEIVDEVAYSEKWHFPLIVNAEGVALERIDPAGRSSSENWHSASVTAGYGTPGYVNSQFQNKTGSDAVISLSSKIISPDNDGWQDYLTIHYKMSSTGFVANIRVFNASGILVKEVVNNGLLGMEGKFTWDGLNEKQQKLSPGIYVVHTELFNVDGKQKVIKNVVVVAGRK